MQRLCSCAERRKLDFKTRKCVLLGYGTNQKGYRLYNLGRMKVIHSRDVVFDEISMPGIQTEEEPYHKCVELEIEEEHDVETPAAPIPPKSVSEEVPVDEQSIRPRDIYSKQTRARQVQSQPYVSLNRTARSLFRI